MTEITVTIRTTRPGYARAKVIANEVTQAIAFMPTGTYFQRSRAYRDGEDRCIDITFRADDEVPA